MKDLKKFTALMLTAALAVSTLAGCSGGEKPVKAESGAEETSAKEDAGKETGKEATEKADAAKDTETEVTEKAGEENDKKDSGENSQEEEIGTITVMGVDWGFGPKQNSSMEQYWEEYFGVDLEIEWVSYKDYAQKLNTLLASGKADDIPDVVQVMSSNNGGFYYPVFAQAVNSGMFVNMDPYLFDEKLVENNRVMKEWSDDLWENTKYKGHTYILPRSISEVAPNSGICVRRDLMKEYGYEEEPKTMDELKEWLLGLSEASGLYALEFSTPDFNDVRVAGFATAFTGQGQWGLDEEGNFVYQPFADGYIDFMNWMKDLYDAGAIDPEFILNQSDVSSWRAGKSVANLNAWYNWNQSEDKVSNKVFDKNTPDTYEAWCLMPVEGPKGYSLCLHSLGYGECIAINAGCSEAKIRKILEIFNSTDEEYMDILMNGVEGLHYDMVDGERVISEDQKIARQEGYVGGWNQVFLKDNFDIVEQKFVEKKCSQEAIDRAYELKKATEEDVKKMGLCSPNNNLISETYNNSWSTLIADCNDMIAQYIMGVLDLDGWNSYVESITGSPEYIAINEEFKAAAQEKEG